MKNKLYLPLLIGILLLSSCTSTKLLPRPEGFDQFLKGSIFVGHNNKTESRVKGELLAVSQDSIIINGKVDDYSSVKVLSFAKKDCNNPKLRLTSIANSPVGIEVWASLLLPLCLTHGWFAVLTLPLNFINLVVLSATIPSSFYTLSIPNDISWEESSKFARFPQGWPQGLNKQDL